MNGPVAWAAGVVLAGVAGGAAWAELADPPRYEVLETGAVLTEAAVAEQFGVVVLFVAIGAVIGLVSGAVAGWTLSLSRGWLVVPLVAVGTLVSALVAWRTGLLLGPPDPQSVTGLRPGDTVPAEIGVDAVAAFFVWPVAGLLGLLLLTWLRPVRPSDVSEPAGPTPPR